MGIDRALAIGDRSSARLFLDAWSARQEPSAAFYGELASRWEELEGWGQAASARRERLARLDDSFARVGELCSLARAERLAGRPLDAFDALTRAAEEHTHIARWRELGLGRMFVEEAFRVTTAAEPEDAPAIFRFADGHAAQVPRLPLVALETAHEAAVHVGAEARAAHYAMRVAAEREQIAGARRG